jgi:hypothetical protein
MNHDADELPEYIHDLKQYGDLEGRTRLSDKRQNLKVEG